ncbi:MAG: hypothetical protein SV775_08220 [Thermodesulfobacteriota bacterium]|nr:hypothetical protein [Thermodesulfobacteriota bacterium]
MDANLFILRVMCILAIASFVPLTAVSFYKYRLRRKEEEYGKLLKALGYDDLDGPAYAPTVKNEFSASDYVLPVGFATLITFLGGIVLVFGPELANIRQVSLVLDGPQFSSLTDPSDHYRVRCLFIIAVSFLGAYIWSIQNLFRRLSIIDLPPSAYYSVGIRILFSISVALMLFYSFMPLGREHFIAAGLPVLAFLAGMFPQRALQYLQERVRFSPRDNESKADPLPLSMIEGVDIFQRVRLFEEGIDNAQNLAKANLVELLLRTPFNPRQIIDWIGQARLYLYFRSDILNLRRASMRTIYDLKNVGKTEDRLRALADDSGLPFERLALVYDIIKNDSDINGIEIAARKLLGLPSSEDE